MGEVPSTKGFIVEANVSCCVIHKFWRKGESEAITAYFHLF
jgi:hypothetical protein